MTHNLISPNNIPRLPITTSTAEGLVINRGLKRIRLNELNEANRTVFFFLKTR